MKKPKDPIRASRRSVIKDKIDPREFQSLNLIYCCEQCSHFDAPNNTCTIGYDSSKHLRKVQLHDYYLSGRMAQCRFGEID
ncbi:MAG: hypothetical protein AAF202_05975 [Pseudomonadota bacterium]